MHSCGFDAIPSDLTVYALHRKSVADGAGELGATTYVLRSAGYAGGFSRGTVGTMVELMRAGSGDPGNPATARRPIRVEPQPIR